ncbi:hypothetical protein [Streptomyces ochraceiscleroticus]|uniref:Uncharacterized protein n=1 Tax=Streptomyces ochraceiscleroticus TaxID=47761 RepID=A0ABW1MHP7_9ACTN|nr:hypothetical protein [Streptomyces ochraceiscleroticus]
MARTEGPHRPAPEQASAAGGTARQDVQHGARVAQEKGQEVAGTARESAAEVAKETAAQGRYLYEKARDQAAGETGAQVRRMAAGLRRIADDLRHMSDEAKPDSPAASLVRQAADRGQLLADRLDRGGPDELLNEVKDFARRRPGLFMAGAALAGFAVSRVGRGIGSAASTPSGAAGEERPSVPASSPSVGTVPPTAHQAEAPQSVQEEPSQQPPDRPLTTPGLPPRTSEDVPPVQPPPGPASPRGTRRPGGEW